MFCLQKRHKSKTLTLRLCFDFNRQDSKHAVLFSIGDGVILRLKRISCLTLSIIIENIYSLKFLLDISDYFTALQITVIICKAAAGLYNLSPYHSIFFVVLLFGLTFITFPIVDSLLLLSLMPPLPAQSSDTPIKFTLNSISPA